MFNFFGQGFGDDDDHHHHHMPRRGGKKSEIDNKKFYDLLEISKDASTADIKKAFRKAAMKHHPDKGGDPEKFKEISKAHEVLSDETKRKIYDEQGEEGLEAGGAGGMDPSDIFGSLFGGGGGARNRGPRKGKDVVFRLKVTLAELYNGSTKKLRLTKQVLCTDCAGKGGSNVEKCTACRGQGRVMKIRQVGPGMIQQMAMNCDKCEGEGEIIAEKSKCKTCKGQKTTKEKKTWEVFVNKGMKNGEKVVFRGESDQTPGFEPGDVIVVLEEAEDDVFVRKDAHLFIKKEITLLEALTGFSFKVTHLDGRVLLLKSSPNTVYQHECVRAIKNEGMPTRGNPFVRGNLYVEFLVTFPPDGFLNTDAKKKLKSILPGPKAENDLPASSATSPSNETDDDLERRERSNSETHVDEVTLVDVDMEQERLRQKFEERAHSEIHDEDEEHDHQPTCRAQ